MRKVWLQSYLGGVPKIIFGFRNDEGIIKSFREYDTLKIPKFVNQETQNQKNIWKGAWT